MDTSTNKTYTMSELESLTEIPRRTIRFYVKEGVIPPPEGEGGGARYGEEHLLKLQVIRVLQGSHLKLGGIQEALRGMSLEEMKRIVAEAGEGKRAWDADSLQNWVSAPQAVAVPRNFSFAGIGKTATASVAETGNVLGKLTRHPLPSSETWRRITVMDGVELNIREDVPAQTREQIIDLLAQLRR